MTWNWQQKEWPEFKYDITSLAQFEDQFLHQSGVIFGAYKHLKDEDQTALKVSVASDEALKTSEIEGEYLNRDSLQFSIRHNFG
jgi:Fic family protein